MSEHAAIAPESRVVEVDELLQSEQIVPDALGFFPSPFPLFRVADRFAEFLFQRFQFAPQLSTLVDSEFVDFLELFIEPTNEGALQQG